MKLVLYGLLLVVLLFLAIRREGFTSSPSTLEEDIKDKKVLALFYNENCGHCKKLKPIWDKAEAKMGDKMVAIDVTNSSDPSVQAITSKYNINAYPTMLVLDHGEKSDEYKGERNMDALVAYVKSL